MSISFICWEEQEEVVETFDCSCTWDGERAARTDCDECHGTGVYEMKGRPHELNWSNGNAALMLEALDVEFDYCGEWSLSELPGLKRKIIKALNVSSTADYAREASVSQQSGCCTIYTAGLSGKDIEVRLQAMLKLVEFAQSNGYAIGWG